MEKRALSISIKEKKDVKFYTVTWQEATGEERRCKSSEYPRPELEGYLDAMAEFIPWMTTIPKENINWIEIAGANFEYSKSGVPYLTLGVSLGVNAGLTTVNCFAFKSPQLPVDLKHANIENPQTIPEKFSALAKLLHDEIIYYADGSRAQTTLFDESVKECVEE